MIAVWALLLSAEALPTFELAAVRAARAPVIDGVVDDAEWAGASRATDFIQYEPRRGEPSPLRTEALVLYDERHVYVAFRAFDSESVTAQLTQRDADLFGDDAVVVLLDTGHDGWSAEIRIPLASMKYAAGEKVTWGLNLGRSRRRSLEVSFWAGPLESRDRVSQAGRLVGLDVKPPLDRFQLVPFGLSQFQDGERSSWKAGGDARCALSSRLAIYATLNPDFATIEADRETVNLTRFEISLPEKRQFFLEGQELFRQRIQTFYSRRIADITAGGKLLGSAGPGRWP